MDDDLDRRITEALAELRAARALAQRNPCADNRQLEGTCEWRLNRLLERRYVVQTRVPA